MTISICVPVASRESVHAWHCHYTRCATTAYLSIDGWRPTCADCVLSVCRHSDRRYTHEVLHRNITDADAPGKLQGTGVRNRTRDHKVYTPKT